MRMTRRSFIATTGVLATFPAVAQVRPPIRFAFDDVIAKAQALAAADFSDERDVEPPALAALDYDDYRKIRFRPEARVSLGAGFGLDLFHRGHIFKPQVDINLLEDGIPVELPYRESQFDFGGLKLGPLPRSLGFAGLRIRAPLNRPDVQDELIVFLGASYFRFLGRGQRYGLSARGLALNAGIPGETEEFPFFREFWIEKPKEDQLHLTLYALMDSPSLAGAFAFTLLPREETSADVTAHIIPRTTLARLGVAPLTSMYFTGGSGPRHTDLFRREVHDSDGLVMRLEGHSTWRPLVNPPQSRTSSFAAQTVQGFGLIQRNRNFDDYQDLEASYELRPSYYVEPMGDWGPGSVELSELATQSETSDNIVASFRPQSPLQPGKPAQWRYRITATGSGEPMSELARAQRTLISDRAARHAGQPAGARLFLVDFAGGDLAFYKSAVDELEISLHTTAGTIAAEPLAWNPHTSGIRARIFTHMEHEQSSEISATLLHRGKVLSETWLTQWSRDLAREQEATQPADLR